MVKYEFASITPWFKNWFNQFAERNTEIKIFITNVISYVYLDKQVCMKIKYRSARSTKHVYAFARVSHMFMTAAGVCVCSQKLLETESIHIFQG